VPGAIVATASSQALAQQAPSAQAETQAFAIASQPLASALDAFVQQTGWQLGYAAALAADVTSPGVKGTMTPEQALRTLLSDTGVRYRLTGGGSVILEAVPADGQAVILAPVRVEALRGITSYQPTDGYVSYYSVAATKTDTPILETPQSISTVAREEMEDRNVKTVAEAVRYSPGVAVDAYGVDPRGFESIQIRGFSSVTTGSFRDGLRQDQNFFAAYATEPYGLERVDIMRGPSGALYGQAEAGGVVDRTTKRPTSDMKQEIHVEAGSWDTYQTGFDIGGAANEDGTIAIRLTGLAREGSTEFDYADGSSQKTSRIFFAPAITFQPNEDTSITVMADLLDDERSPQFNTYADDTIGRTSVVTGEPGFDKFNQFQYSIGYDASHRIDDVWKLRQVARYSHIEVDYQMVASNGLQADGQTLNRYVWSSPDKLDQIAVDNQAEAKFTWGPTKHVALMGGDYSRSVDDFSYYNGTVGTLNLNAVSYTGAALPAPYQVTEQTLEQWGVYLQDQITLYDDWILTLGGRFSSVNQVTKQALAGTTEDKSDSAFTGRAGLTYLFDNGLAPYLSYTEGFVPTQGTNLSGESFEPQESVQYEAGIKYQPPEVNALFTAAAYQLTKTNVLTRDPANINASIQTGEVRSRGIELEAKASLFQGLDATVAYTYTDALVTKSTEVNLDKVPVLVPEHTASAWLQYHIDQGPLDGLTLGGGVRYVGQTYNDSANTDHVPDYALVDATIGYELTENAALKLTANNLLNKEYQTTCSFGACYYGPGRQVNARLTYQW
jgi:iron complex outermembrane receptor protein